MIVNINDANREQYNNLFVEAYKFLQKNGKIEAEDTRTSIANLPEYYSHMNDFFTHYGWEYIFLPLDENTFKIDLNTRNITVPTNFKQVTMQSDTMAEMIIFEVDRYFDYMDLANTNIYVQWKAPSEQGEGRATRIKMVDADSTPDKLRFAWPISEELTKEPGSVKFSVRFFRIAPGEEDAQKMVYSLNTQEASFNIIAAHQNKLNEKSEVEFQSNDLFNQVIINSNYSNQGVPAPLEPDFWINENYSVYVKNTDANTQEIMPLIPVEQANLDEDTLSLYAEAIVQDKNEIQYTWYYYSNTVEYVSFTDEEKFNDNPNVGYFTKDEDGKYVKTTIWVPNNMYIEKRLYKIESLDEYETKEVLIKFKKPENGWVKIPGVRYYTFVEGMAAIEVEELAGSEEVINLNDYEFLYRKFAKLTIKARETDEEGNPIESIDDKPITGKYYVQAINVSTDGQKSTAQESTNCELPSPNEIQIDSDLNKTGNFGIDVEVEIKDEEEGTVEKVVEFKANDLSVTLIKNEDSVDSINYQWYKTTQEPEIDDEGNLIYNGFTAISTDTVYVPTERGWYYVAVQASANREKSEIKNSNIAKVTAEPVAPSVTSNFTDTFVSVGDITEDGRIFSYTVDLENKENALYSESLIYQWEMNADPLNNNTLDWQKINGTSEHWEIEDNEITIYNTINSSSFRLIVTNVLNGKEASTEGTKFDIINNNSL